MKGEAISSELRKKCDLAEAEAQLMLGIRAVSTVTLVRLPAARTPQSKAGFVRECRRLFGGLPVSIRTVVMNAVGEAAQ